MKPFRVLLADDEQPVLQSYATLLQRRGYDVTSVGSYEDARNAIHEGYFHLAILDRRLRSKTDDLDNSGIELAKEKSGAIAKIILTAYPTFETSRDALVPGSSGERSIISYVSKKEPIEMFFDHVERAIGSLGIRRDLAVHWKAVDRASLVESLISAEVGSALLNQRAEEVEDLIGQLFPKAKEVHLERLLWQSTGRAALLARAIFAGAITKFCVVIVGTCKTVLEEVERFRSSGLSTSWPAVPLLERSCSTSRFAANLLTFANVDLAHARGLGEMYMHGPERAFSAAMQHLLEAVLPPWQRTPIQQNQQSPEVLSYRARLPLQPELFANAIGRIKDRAAGFGLGLHLEVGDLRASLNGREHVFPDPDYVLSEQASRPVSFYLVPGILDGENVLVDQQGGLGLTNFAEAGGGPLLAPFWELESAIRFDWSDGQKLGALFESDRLLTEGSFSRPEVRDVESSARKMLRAVLLIHRHAEPLLQGKRVEWHIGLLWEIGRRIADMNQLPHLDSGQLVRMSHLILAAGLTAQAIAQAHRNITASKKSRPALLLDERSLAVLLHGERVTLTRQSFNLLKCLYEHSGRPCNPETLVLGGLSEKHYDPEDQSQKERLATAIRRLRERIEQNPGEPKLLRTEGGGYCLHTDA